MADGVDTLVAAVCNVCNNNAVNSTSTESALNTITIVVCVKIHIHKYVIVCCEFDIEDSDGNDEPSFTEVKCWKMLAQNKDIIIDALKKKCYC